METRQRHDSPDSIKSEVFFDEYDWEAVDYGRIPDSADVKDIRSEHEAMKAQKIYEEMRAAALEREEMTIRVRPEDSVTTQRDSEEQKYRAACTVLLTRLHHRATEKDIKRFFEKHAGKVKHVHLLYQLNSKQSKGICYLEFVHKKGAERALECNTHSFFDRPLNIQQSPDDLISVADKEYLRMCRTWGPTRVQVTNFHPRLTIQDITELFSPYGKVDDVEIIPDDQCGASGLATIIFRKVDEAKAAIKAMDGYELMGLEMKVKSAFEPIRRVRSFRRNIHEIDNGIMINSPLARIAFMQQLLGRRNLTTNFTPAQAPEPEEIPPPSIIPDVELPPLPSNPTSCLLFTKMFPLGRPREYYEDVIDEIEAECSRYGKVLRISYNRKEPGGLVYIEFEDIKASIAARNALQSRHFAGNMISIHFSFPPQAARR